MPQVKVAKKFKSEPKAVYKAVKAYMKERGTLEKMGGKVKWKDKNTCAEIKGDQFEGELIVAESGKGAQVEIIIDLPFLLSPFKGKVKTELTKHLGRLKV